MKCAAGIRRALIIRQPASALSADAGRRIGNESAGRVRAALNRAGADARGGSDLVSVAVKAIHAQAVGREFASRSRITASFTS